MAHQYMSYTRDESGRITRNHQVVLVDDLAAYAERETLQGWPESHVYWQVLADGSAVGVAPQNKSALAAAP